MTYREEFPDFDPATMPPIPEWWEDASWRNDACPLFKAGGLLVYVDYADVQLREMPVEAPRFVVRLDEPSEQVLESDDWDEVLRHVERAR